MQTVVTNGHKGRTCTYGVSNVTDLQSAPFASWVPCDIKGRWSNFFITWYASLIGVLCLWYSTGIRLLSTCCTSPRHWVAPKRPDASGYYMLRHSYPPTYCANRNFGTTCWDSNPHLPVLETGVLSIKLRLYIIAYFWVLFRHI